ncbi:unnamed protein product [Protopolystoma xenopodis]|uniref:Uncharacterized protein n=1 Tax=Protopolystoma xenopodis TaxID=117903 RepID=A0A448X3G3_9PLAT|nr:unnamed protein product [Protopolystoma xenopodis]
MHPKSRQRGVLSDWTAPDKDITSTWCPNCDVPADLKLSCLETGRAELEGKVVWSSCKRSDGPRWTMELGQTLPSKQVSVEHKAPNYVQMNRRQFTLQGDSSLRFILDKSWIE